MCELCNFIKSFNGILKYLYKNIFKMELTKKELYEIIDSNGELIGKEAVPTTGSDLETS